MTEEELRNAIQNKRRKADGYYSEYERHQRFADEFKLDSDLAENELDDLEQQLRDLEQPGKAH